MISSKSEGTPPTIKNNPSVLEASLPQTHRILGVDFFDDFRQSRH
jgi:hypothetical protein